MVNYYKRGIIKFPLGGLKRILDMFFYIKVYSTCFSSFFFLKNLFGTIFSLCLSTFWPSTVVGVVCSIAPIKGHSITAFIYLFSRTRPKFKVFKYHFHQVFSFFCLYEAAFEILY